MHNAVAWWRYLVDSFRYTSKMMLEYSCIFMFLVKLSGEAGSLENWLKSKGLIHQSSVCNLKLSPADFKCWTGTIAHITEAYIQKGFWGFQFPLTIPQFEWSSILNLSHTNMELYWPQVSETHSRHNPAPQFHSHRCCQQLLLKTQFRILHYFIALVISKGYYMLSSYPSKWLFQKGCSA